MQQFKICVYASSYEKSLDIYKQSAQKLGIMLAERNHICINGGGSFGCMGALNDGCKSRQGKVIAVIHEMWVNKNELYDKKSELHNSLESEELIIVDGHNLAKRKEYLNAQADAFIALPGGPGTWDELWEIICEDQLDIGIAKRKCPIVIVNINGYYDGFIQQMQRAYNDGIMRKKPDEVVQVVKNEKSALQYIEFKLNAQLYKDNLQQKNNIQQNENNKTKKFSNEGQVDTNKKKNYQNQNFALGIIMGIVLQTFMIKLTKNF